MPEPSEPLTIYTIGHSSVPPEELVALLTGQGVAGVVDVRRVPFSRWTPQFNRDALERSLTEHGLAYAFAGDDLGGRPTDPTGYRDGLLPEGEADYLSLVDYPEVARRPWFRRGLARLVELASERPTAIMCSEEDPLRCQRHHPIARALIERGIAVAHIRRGGGVERAGPPPKQLSLLP